MHSSQSDLVTPHPQVGPQSLSQVILSKSSPSGTLIFHISFPAGWGVGVSLAVCEFLQFSRFISRWNLLEAFLNAVKVCPSLACSLSPEKRKCLPPLRPPGAVCVARPSGKESHPGGHSLTSSLCKEAPHIHSHRSDSTRTKVGPLRADCPQAASRVENWVTSSENDCA